MFYFSTMLGSSISKPCLTSMYPPKKCPESSGWSACKAVPSANKKMLSDVASRRREQKCLQLLCAGGWSRWSRRGFGIRVNIMMLDISSGDIEGACQTPRSGGVLLHTAKKPAIPAAAISYSNGEGVKSTQTDTRSQTVVKQTSRSERTHIRLRRLAALTLSLSPLRTPQYSIGLLYCSAG